MLVFKRFWLDTIKSALQAAFAGLVIAPIAGRELSKSLIVLFVIIIVGFVLWAKTLSYEIEKIEKKEGAKHDH